MDVALPLSERFKQRLNEFIREKAMKQTKKIMQHPTVRMHFVTDSIKRSQLSPDPSTIYEIIDSDEEEVVDPEPSHNTKAYQSAGKMKCIKQQVQQRKKASSTSSPSIINFSFVFKRTHQIFTDEQEAELVGFVRDASDYYNGMTSKDVRILAYVYAVCNQVDLPERWREKNEASFAWCSSFTKRNKLRLLHMVSNSQPKKQEKDPTSLMSCGE